MESDKLDRILESKKNRTNALNIRIDKTVPHGFSVDKRICNENCVFVRELGIACHKDNSYRGTGLAISNGEMVEIIRKIYYATKVPINIHIAGDGEPTLFEEELLDLIQALRKLNFIRLIKLTTNGTRLTHGTPSLALRLKNSGLDEVNVSVHSLNKFEFQKITGINALDTVLSGIEMTIKADISTSINCLVRKETFGELEDYINLSSRLGIRIKFFGLLDETLKNQKYADDLLDKMKEKLIEIADTHVDYTEPYSGTLFQIGRAIIDLKDSRINNCPILNCKVRDKCLEGCRYHVRLSPTGILQPCGMRTDNILDMKDNKVSSKEILYKLASGGKLILNEVKK